MDAIYHRTHLGDALLHALQKLCVSGELEGAEARRILADFDEVMAEELRRPKSFSNPTPVLTGRVTEYNFADMPRNSTSSAWTGQGGPTWFIHLKDAAVRIGGKVHPLPGATQLGVRHRIVPPSAEAAPAPAPAPKQHPRSKLKGERRGKVAKPEMTSASKKEEENTSGSKSSKRPKVETGVGEGARGFTRAGGQNDERGIEADAPRELGKRKRPREEEAVGRGQSAGGVFSSVGKKAARGRGGGRGDRGGATSGRRARAGVASVLAASARNRFAGKGKAAARSALGAGIKEEEDSSSSSSSSSSDSWSSSDEEGDRKGGSHLDDLAKELDDDLDDLLEGLDGHGSDGESEDNKDGGAGGGGGGGGDERTSKKRRQRSLTSKQTARGEGERHEGLGNTAGAEGSDSSDDDSSSSSNESATAAALEFEMFMDTLESGGGGGGGGGRGSGSSGGVKEGNKSSKPRQRAAGAARAGRGGGGCRTSGGVMGSKTPSKPRRRAAGAAQAGRGGGARSGRTPLAGKRKRNPGETRRVKAGPVRKRRLREKAAKDHRKGGRAEEEGWGVGKGDGSDAEVDSDLERELACMLEEEEGQDREDIEPQRGGRRGGGKSPSQGVSGGSGITSSSSGEESDDARGAIKEFQDFLTGMEEGGHGPNQRKKAQERNSVDGGVDNASGVELQDDDDEEVTMESREVSKGASRAPEGRGGAKEPGPGETSSDSSDGEDSDGGRGGSGGGGGASRKEPDDDGKAVREFQEFLDGMEGAPGAEGRRISKERKSGDTSSDTSGGEGSGEGVGVALGEVSDDGERAINEFRDFLTEVEGAQGAQGREGPIEQKSGETSSNSSDGEGGDGGGNGGSASRKDSDDDDENAGTRRFGEVEAVARAEGRGNANEGELDATSSDSSDGGGGSGLGNGGSASRKASGDYEKAKPGRFGRVEAVPGADGRGNAKDRELGGTSSDSSDGEDGSGVPSGGGSASRKGSDDGDDGERAVTEFQVVSKEMEGAPGAEGRGGAEDRKSGESSSDRAGGGGSADGGDGGGGGGGGGSIEESNGDDQVAEEFRGVLEGTEEGQRAARREETKELELGETSSDSEHGGDGGDNSGAESSDEKEAAKGLQGRGVDRGQGREETKERGSRGSTSSQDAEGRVSDSAPVEESSDGQGVEDLEDCLNGSGTDDEEEGGGDKEEEEEERGGGQDEEEESGNRSDSTSSSSSGEESDDGVVQEFEDFMAQF